jgi:hypothetical protein
VHLGEDLGPEIAFEGPINIQKVYLKKKNIGLVKKLKALLSV